MKNKNPLKPLTQTSEKSQTNSNWNMCSRYVLEHTVVFWHTGWEDCADKDIFGVCMFVYYICIFLIVIAKSSGILLV